MLKLYRYIFYRVALHQRQRIASRREADLSATIWVAAVPWWLSFVVLNLLSRAVGAGNILEDYTYTAVVTFGVGGVVLLLHYKWLGAREKVEEIDREFGGGPPWLGKFGGVVVMTFYLVSAVVSFLLILV